MKYSYSISTKCSIAAVVTLTVVMSGERVQAQPGWVISHKKISDTQGGFTGILDDSDRFGFSVTVIGDLNSDGVDDLAVGAGTDGDGGLNRGAVWILFLNTDGTVNSHQKISDTQGGFTGVLSNLSGFGRSVASIGDLNGDGVIDLVVGEPGGDDGGVNRGAVWVLFLNADGTVNSHQKISDTQGDFTGILDDNDEFGMSLASLGDFDGDGVNDLAVGAALDDDVAADRGAVWLLFLNTDGTVKSHQKISDSQGSFKGILNNGDRFGSSVASLGDIDSDGVSDLAVGATGDDDDGGLPRGAVWILFLNADGTVKSHQKINNTHGGFTGNLDDFDNFGYSVARLGDLDDNCVADLAVGAPIDDYDSSSHGAIWILFLNSDGTVKSHQKITDTQGGFKGILDYQDRFGQSMISLGDKNGDGMSDLAVGASQDGDGGFRRGAVWMLFLDPTTGSCPWDLDNNCSVSTSDLLELFAQWGTDGPADFDINGTVGTYDLLILFANWGPCPK